MSTPSYDAETLVMLTRVFDAAWSDAQGMVGNNPLDAVEMRSTLAMRILAAANDGERDPVRLKLIALRGIGDSPR